MLPYRYFVFASEHYYPSGGMGDLRGKFQTKEQAMNFMDEIENTFDVVDYYDMLKEMEHSGDNY
jgi:hypothetical protein